MGIPLVLAWAAQQPWALRPETLALLRAILLRRHAEGRRPAEEIEAALATGESRVRKVAERYFSPDEDDYYSPSWDEDGTFLGYRSETTGKPMDRSRGVVAILGVYGVISQRQSQVDDISGPGGTSIERLTSRFRAARDDAAVKAIVLDVDSPGGGVYGVQELGEEIRATRGDKPIAAVANSLAASAAYWLFTQVDPGEAVVTPSGEVGSVGVFAAHEDLSKMLEIEGMRVTLISAGKYKTEGNPFEALGEEARTAIQARVDDYYAAFVRAVAKGRGVGVEDVRKGFGEGRVVGADQAVAERMADRVGTLDDTVRRIGARRASPQQPSGRTPHEQAAMEAAAAAARIL